MADGAHQRAVAADRRMALGVVIVRLCTTIPVIGAG